MLRRFKFLLDTLKDLRSAARDMDGVHQASLHAELDRLRQHSRYAEPAHLIPYGRKSYSQCDEDGILAEIFRRIGTTNQCFVEFGIGDGLENNTLTLLFEGWHGLWVEASAKSVVSIVSSFSDIINSRQLKVVQSFITRENIDRIIAENIEHKEIDLLSVDIDGNDFHVLAAISSISPRVIVIEYNAKFVPPLLYCMEYDESHTWDGSDCFGASLKFLEINLRNRGYSLVGCNIAGANAFFVRDDLVADRFLRPFSAETHHEPARYHLIGIRSGHSASYRTLAKSLQHHAIDSTAS